MHQRIVAGAVLQEAVERVHLVDRQPARGRDDRQARRRHALQQRPVGGRATGDLDDVEAHALDLIDRSLVERRAHAQHSLRPRLGQHLLVGLPGQARRQEARHVLVGGGFPVIGMHEVRQVAELELHRGAHTGLGHRGAMLADHALAMFHIALMVVGQIQHEEVAEVELVGGHGSLTPSKGLRDGSPSNNRSGRAGRCCR
jgi:hypothetical protein